MEEWIPLIDQKSDQAIEVRWTGTKQDTRLLRKHCDKEIVLVVPDLPAMERAACYLGLPLMLETKVLNKAAATLTDRLTTDWVQFARAITTPVATGVLTRLCADAIRAGKKPNLRRVVNGCLHGGLSPLDADVLLTLMSQGAKL